MIRRPPRSTQGVSSAASDVYKRQTEVVTQADPCPGNVLVTEDHARFVDYEATSIHHPAVDVVNLVMPWSSCDGLVGVPAEFLDAVREGFLDGSRYAGSWLADEPMIGLAGQLQHFS